MEMHFRLGNIDDLPEIISLVKAAIAHMEDYGIMQWDELYPTVGDFAIDIAADQLYVGLIDGSIAVIYTLNQLFDAEYKSGKWKLPKKPFLVLHRLCVHPKFQNLGIAQRTMTYIEMQVTALQIKAVRLDVYSQNPYALKLYRKSGYTEVGTVNWRKGMFYLMEKYL